MEEITRRYNMDKERLRIHGHNRDDIYHILSERYPISLVENDKDFMPQCIDTRNSICMPGTIARYTIGNYDELNNFDYIYHLIFQTINTPITLMVTSEGSPITQMVTSEGSPITSMVTPEGSPKTPMMTPEGSPKTPEGPPPPVRIPSIIVLGIFLIFVEYGRDENGEVITIKYARTDWEDDRDKDGSTILDTPRFEILMESPDFKKYIETCITKIVQDRFVFDRSIRTTDNQEFHIFLDFYYNRSLTQSDAFHQDGDTLFGVDYFTLTYILPEDKVILGASLLVEHGGELGKQLKPNEYASISVAVKNLTTVGLTNNNQYHSTPAPISCRQFKTKKGNCRIPSKYKQRRVGILEVTEQNPHTFIRDYTEEYEIDLVPLNLEPLPESEMESVKEVIDNTRTTRRSFIRCWYATMPGHSTFSNFYSFDIVKKDLDELRDEALNIDIITADTIFQHVLGGKHKTKKGRTRKQGRTMHRNGQITKLRKLFYNPNKNIILKT